MRRGFTLVELLVALAVAGILLAAALPSYAAYAIRARRAEARVALVESMQQQERFYTRHQRYVAYSASAPHPQFRWWSGGAPATSAYELVAQSCQGGSLVECVELRALPGTANVDTGFADEECGALTLRSDGGRDAATGRKGCWP